MRPLYALRRTLRFKGPKETKSVQGSLVPPFPLSFFVIKKEKNRSILATSSRTIIGINKIDAVLRIRNFCRQIHSSRQLPVERCKARPTAHAAHALESRAATSDRPRAHARERNTSGCKAKAPGAGSGMSHWPVITIRSASHSTIVLRSHNTTMVSQEQCVTKTCRNWGL